MCIIHFVTVWQSAVASPACRDWGQRGSRAWPQRGPGAEGVGAKPLKNGVSGRSPQKLNGCVYLMTNDD